MHVRQNNVGFFLWKIRGRNIKHKQEGQMRFLTDAEDEWEKIDETNL